MPTYFDVTICIERELDLSVERKDIEFIDVCNLDITCIMHFIFGERRKILVYECPQLHYILNILIHPGQMQLQNSHDDS